MLEEDPRRYMERAPDRRIGLTGIATEARTYGESGAIKATVLRPCTKGKCGRDGIDGDGGSDGRNKAERCSKEAVAGQYPRMEWTNLPGV